MRIKKISFFTILFYLSLNIYSQEIKIEGSLLDSTSKEPIPYSNLMVLNSNDSLIEGSVSNVEGRFYLKVDLKKGYYIKARSIGYQEKIVRFDKENYSSELNLEILLKKDSTLLKEVDIVAQNQVITKFDRKIYKVDEGKKAAARDIFDILRTLPGVVVDESNNVTYKGGSPQIMIDDMPAKYIYPDLAMIPIDNIDKIELIDASMRSGGDGTGGIINIKLKKVNTDGFSGTARLRGGLTERGDRSNTNSFINANYKNNKLLVFNNLWFYESRYHSESNSFGVKTFDQEKYDFQGITNNEYMWNYLYNYIGIQYQISEKTKLMIATGLSSSKNISDSYSENQSFDQNDNIFRKYSTQSFGDGKSLSASTSAYIRHKFDTTLRELTVYLSYSLPKFYQEYNSSTVYDREIENSQVLNSIDTLSNYSSDKNSSYYYSLYYNHPINEKTRWNLRYYAYQTYLKDDIYNYSINGVNIPRENYIKNGNENTQNLSFRFGSKFNKWKIDGGINQQFKKYNIDISHTNSDLTDTIVNINNSYYTVEPSLNIFYELDSLQDFKITFSRTVRVPYYEYLDGFIHKNSLYSWSSGNPNLEPSKYFNIYFSYTKNKPTWNLSTELFYNQTDNAISYISFPITELIYFSRPENIAFENRIGFDFSSYFSIKSKLSFNFSTSIYHSKIDADGIEQQLDSTIFTFDDIVRKNFGYNAKLSTTYRITKSTSVMAFMQYQSLETSLKGYQNPKLNSYISFTQFFFKRKLQLSFSINNLLNDLIERKSYSNYYGVEDTDITTYSTNYNRIYSLSIKYIFRYGDRNTGNVGQGKN